MFLEFKRREWAPFSCFILILVALSGDLSYVSTNLQTRSIYMLVYIVIESWSHGKLDAYVFKSKKEAEEFKNDSERHFPANKYEITSKGLVN